MKTKLTKASIEKPKLPPAGRPHFEIWDTSKGMQGFGIRVQDTGAVSFIARYWTGKRERWTTLGAHPRMTLEQARKEARDLLRAAASGPDPIEAKQAALAAKAAADTNTVAGASKEWLATLPTAKSKRGRPFSPRTIDCYQDGMKRVIETFGDRPLLELDEDSIGRWHARLTKERGVYSANRSLDVLGIFLAWCRRRKLVPKGFDPTADVEGNYEQKRGEDAAVRLSNTQEGKLVAAILERAKTDPVGATALLVLFDTGRRKEEVLSMTWDRLDLEAGTYNAGSTKGKASGDVFFVPKRSCDAISRLPRIVGCNWIFHGQRKDGRRSTIQSAWEHVKEIAGIESLSPSLRGFRAHDLRHNRATQWLAAEVAPQLVQHQLGHSDLSMLKTYSHLIVDDVKAALSKLEPTAAAEPAEIVDIDSRR